jgi:hypothetical protein
VLLRKQLSLPCTFKILYYSIITSKVIALISSFCSNILKRKYQYVKYLETTVICQGINNKYYIFCTAAATSNFSPEYTISNTGSTPAALSAAPTACLSPLSLMLEQYLRMHHDSPFKFTIHGAKNTLVHCTVNIRSS